jgi:hypothetical protein
MILAVSRTWPRAGYAPLLVLATSAGCAASAGVLGATGYTQPVFAYRVDYPKTQAGSFLGPDWRVDNFILDQTTGNWNAKRGPSYEATRELDEDGDGNISMSERNTEHIYDLRLVNTHDDGVIWVKAHPLAFQDSARDLDVELAGYADSLCGTGAYYQGTVFSTGHVKSRQFTTFVVDESKRRVADLEGVVATVEVAETARVTIEPTFRSAKIRVFMAKLGYDTPEKPQKTSVSVPSPWPRVACEEHPKEACERRVGLLVVGYVNEASHFDQHLPEYDTFLSEISQGHAAPKAEPSRGPGRAVEFPE